MTWSAWERSSAIALREGLFGRENILEERREGETENLRSESQVIKSRAEWKKKNHRVGGHSVVIERNRKLALHTL